MLSVCATWVSACRTHTCKCSIKVVCAKQGLAHIPGALVSSGTLSRLRSSLHAPRLGLRFNEG